tara:strand:- start:325 stop:1299 length:975 start_codon:yes stop_codon:yes gene_type:complete
MAKEEVKQTTETTETKSTESTLYYFYTTGCGFCKKVEPHVDELNKEGHNILKLDLANGDNRKLQEEVKKEYNIQCGTPLFVDAESGNMVCGYREKDILEKWAKGEEIPAPPRPKGVPPKPPLHGASEEEVNTWKDEYQKWADNNKHLPKVQTVDEILARPRPKSEPPRPPMAPNNTDTDIDKWAEAYENWTKENSHLPNLIPVETLKQRIKANRDGAQAPGAPGVPGAPGLANDVVLKKVQALELKLDALMKHLGVQSGPDLGGHSHGRPTPPVSNAPAAGNLPPKNVGSKIPPKTDISVTSDGRPTVKSTPKAKAVKEQTQVG